MDAKAIHAAIKKAGFSVSAAAEAIGCSASTLRNLTARRTESRSAARKLALLIGKDVAEVFPDIPRYSKPSPAEAHKAMVAAARKRLEEATQHTAKSA